MSYDVPSDEWDLQRLQDEHSNEKFYNCSAAIAIDNDRILITGGGSPPQALAWILTVSTTTLVRDSKMLSPRNAHAITRCASRVYVLGGFSGKERLNTVEMYVQADEGSSWNSTWVKRAPMKHRRHYLAACTVAESLIYVFGGFFGGSDSEINESIERYCPHENAWNLLTIRLKNPLWACVAVPLDENNIIIIGGKNKNRNNEVNMLDL